MLGKLDKGFLPHSRMDDSRCDPPLEEYLYIATCVSLMTLTHYLNVDPNKRATRVDKLKSYIDSKYQIDEKENMRKLVDIAGKKENIVQYLNEHFSKIKDSDEVLTQIFNEVMNLAPL